MVSSVKRRLSVSVDDVQRRLDPEQSERRGLLGGPFGRWLEDELDYQRNMLPGIDNMWLLLDQDSDFNPVWCAYARLVCPIPIPGRRSRRAPARLSTPSPMRRTSKA